MKFTESPPANASTFSTCSSACTVVQAPNFKSAQQDTFSCHDGGSPDKNPLTCSHEEDMILSQHDGTPKQKFSKIFFISKKTSIDCSKFFYVFYLAKQKLVAFDPYFNYITCLIGNI